MPPRKRPASESCEADGGFVEDAPKSKKTKATTGGTKNKSSAVKKEEPESHYWELGQRTRRVQINEFKGKQLVDFREFYEKDEKMLPGKKGISLNIDQFTAFIEQLPEIEKALKAKGITVPRPQYGEARASLKAEEQAEEENEEEEEEEEAVKKPAKAVEASEDEDDAKPVAESKLDRFRHRANHEATSDEDN